MYVYYLVEGICDNILPAGTYSIEIWTSGSNLYAQPTRMLSGGFNTPSRLHVQEVRKDRAVDGGNYVLQQWYIAMNQYYVRLLLIKGDMVKYKL